MAAFANAKNFAATSGRSVVEIRQLCKLQVIPNEKSGRDYRIDVEAAMEILKSRAASFTGHDYEFTSKPAEPKVVPITKPKQPKPAKKTGNNFLDRLNQLAKEAAKEAKQRTGAG